MPRGRDRPLRRQLPRQGAGEGEEWTSVESAQPTCDARSVSRRYDQWGFRDGGSDTHGHDGLLQSIGGARRLPLRQHGACPFPCTPLRSVLMLVTPTDREGLPMFPGFRRMAVSM
jgi:hypothetical protein